MHALIASITSEVSNNHAHGKMKINSNKIFLLGIDIYGQEFHDVVNHFKGKKRADNILFKSAKLTVWAVCT